VSGELRRRVPLLGNLYWGQLLYGILLGVVGGALVAHYAGWARLSSNGVVLRWVGLVLATLAFVVYLQNVHKFGLVPDYSLKCRFCNGPVNRYSEFCEHCGADLIAEEHLVPCPKCGVDLYEGTKHCPECGANVAARAKGGKKKGKKGRGEPEPVDTAEVGWSTPVDAVSGFPPDEERGRP
jgi:predicted RNA-binding Zn-ribbon protein involved in translation (DUF1610 family)